MSAFTISPAFAPVLERLAGTGRAIAEIAAGMAELRAASHEAQRLLAMPDEALARRGLKRNEVITRAFAGYLARP